jgi:hypothetical protein
MGVVERRVRLVLDTRHTHTHKQLLGDIFLIIIISSSSSSSISICIISIISIIAITIIRCIAPPPYQVGERPDSLAHVVVLHPQRRLQRRHALLQALPRRRHPPRRLHPRRQVRELGGDLTRPPGLLHQRLLGRASTAGANPPPRLVEVGLGVHYAVVERQPGCSGTS